MTKRNRQIYLIILVLITVVSLPLVLLYSSGYRVNWQTYKLELTGTLLAQTLPKTAQLNIQELNRTVTTPALINNLTPGNYHVTISKTNYANWTTAIVIKPQQTVNLNTVLLFFNQSTPQLITHYPNDIVTDNKNITTIANLSNQLQYQLAQLNLSDNLTILNNHADLFTILDKTTGNLYLGIDVNNSPPIKLDAKVIQAQWDNQNNQLLYASPYELKIYDATAKTVRVILRQSKPLTEALWHPLNTNIVYVENNQIKVIETRASDQPNIFTLYYGTKPNNVKINKKGDALYFTDSDKILTLQIM
jgi:hypothetical protein